MAFCSRNGMSFKVSLLRIYLAILNIKFTNTFRDVPKNSPPNAQKEWKCILIRLASLKEAHIFRQKFSVCGEITSFEILSSF